MLFVCPILKLLFVFSVIDDTTKEIVYRDYVDISVAVATPKVSQAHYNLMQRAKCPQVKGRQFSAMTSLTGSGGSCNP